MVGGKYVLKRSKMYNNDGINRRYSEGYKLKVLAELTTGN